MFIRENVHKQLVELGWTMDYDEMTQVKKNEAFKDGICASTRYCKEYYTLWITYQSDGRHDVDIIKYDDVIKTVKIRNIISIVKKLEI